MNDVNACSMCDEMLEAHPEFTLLWGITWEVTRVWALGYNQSGQ